MTWPIIISEKKKYTFTISLIKSSVVGKVNNNLISDLDRKFTIWPKHAFELMGQFGYNLGQATGRLVNRNLGYVWYTVMVITL